MWDDRSYADYFGSDNLLVLLPPILEQKNSKQIKVDFYFIKVK